MTADHRKIALLLNQALAACRGERLAPTRSLIARAAASLAAAGKKEGRRDAAEVCRLAAAKKASQWWQALKDGLAKSPENIELDSHDEVPPPPAVPG